MFEDKKKIRKKKFITIRFERKKNWIRKRCRKSIITAKREKKPELNRPEVETVLFRKRGKKRKEKKRDKSNLYQDIKGHYESLISIFRDSEVNRKSTGRNITSTSATRNRQKWAGRRFKSRGSRTNAIDRYRLTLIWFFYIRFISGFHPVYIRCLRKLANRK